MNKAVFLDRDGTINVEKNYLYKKEDFEFLPGVIPALKQLQAAGYLLIIVTNQSGIARGYYSEQDFLDLNDWIITILAEQGIYISKVYYCPHHPDADNEKYRVNCECRKPKPGMFLKAKQDFDLDLGACFAIGDKIRDCCICELTECRGFLIGNNEKKEVIERVKTGEFKNVSYAADLFKAAVQIIASENL